MRRLRNSGRGRVFRLAQQSALYGTAGVLGKAAALLTVPYLTRQLGPEGYGLADLATSSAALLTLLTRFAGDIPVMRLAAGQPEGADRKKIFSSYLVATLAVSVATALVLIPAAGLIAGSLWSTPDATTLVLVTLALVPVSAAQAALVNVLRIAQRPKAFAALAVVDLFAQLLLAVALVALGFGPLGVVLGFLLGSLVGLTIAGATTRAHLTAALDLSMARRVVREGLPFLPGAAAFVLADTISRVLAANLLSVADVGQLALAIRLASVMSLAAYAFSMAWGPYGLSLQPSPYSQAIFRTVLSTQLVVVGAVAVGVGAFGPELAVLIGGVEFRDASIAMPGLLMAVGLTGPLYVLTTAAGISNRARWVAYASVTGAAVQLVAVGALSPVVGLAGFALGSVIGRIVTTLILARGVAATIDLGWDIGLHLVPPLVVLLVVQALNEGGTETFLLRIVIGIGSAAVGLGVLGWRLVQDHPQAHSQEVDH